MTTVALLFWASVVAIGYVYLGYPLLLGAVARLRPQSPEYPNSVPLVSLVIVAYNEQSTLAAKLNNSLALDYPADRYEIIVATDGSTDTTVDIVRSFARRGVRLSHSNERRGKVAAINRAMRGACGDIVVLSDANNLYDRASLRAVVAPFVDPSVGAACGNKRIASGDGALGDSEGAYWKYEGWIKRQETRLGSTVGVVGELLALRRDLFDPPPENIINDDSYLALRILKRGYRVVYVTDAISFERVSASAEDEITRRARMVAGVYQAIAWPKELMPWRQPVACWELVSHKFMRPLVPLWMIAAFAANLLLVIFESRLWAILFAAQVAFYSIALAGRHHTADGRVSKALYLSTFLVSSNFAALQGLIRYSTGRQSAQWTRVRRRA